MSSVVDVVVPDIGSDGEVDVIEVLVNPGDRVNPEDPLISLESDKATMDVPSPGAGTVKEIKVQAGDKVSEGSIILTLDSEGNVSVSAAPEPAAPPEPEPQPTPAVEAPAPEVVTESASDNTQRPADTSVLDPAAPPSVSGAPAISPSPPPPPVVAKGEAADPSTIPHATPAIRRFARELGADLSRVSGTGRKGRILKEDVQAWIKQQLTGSGSATGVGIEPIPAVDFSKFGETETVALSRIKRISGPFLQRAWLNLPHVTHHDEADITKMDEFRKSLKADAESRGVKLTPLVFFMKALVTSMKEFPQFNASLAPDGENLILKKYFHIGIAVDTPEGLVVPVVRDVDKKGLLDLAEELGDISSRAREGKLKSAELQGGSISISSLGGIGGTAFTPIINAPEVAILGVARARMQPVWNGTEFEPRLMQPLDLSYDHRVVDGAEAARFTVYLRDLLSDIRRLVL